MAAHYRAAARPEMGGLQAFWRVGDSLPAGLLGHRGQTSATQQAEFEGNGWTVLPGVFGAGQRAILVQAALRVLERPGPEVSQIGSALFQKIFYQHHRASSINTCVR